MQLTSLINCFRFIVFQGGPGHPGPVGPDGPPGSKVAYLIALKGCVSSCFKSAHTVCKNDKKPSISHTYIVTYSITYIS